MVTVGLPYSFQGQFKLDEVTGGSPYGATTIAAADGSRQPTENELASRGRGAGEGAAKRNAAPLASASSASMWRRSRPS